MSEFVKQASESLKRLTTKLTVKTPTGKANSNPPSVERRVRRKKKRLETLFKSLH